jgi:hypothetical protein
VDDCDRVDEFADRVIQRITNMQSRVDQVSGRRNKRCLIAGIVDGGYDSLEIIQDQCWETCFFDGELVGTVSAQRYCELAIETNGDIEAEEWVRQPINTCGFDFEMSCDGAFVGESYDYRNAQGRCLPYTEGDFFDVWDNTRLRACDYSQYRAKIEDEERD